MDIVATDLRVSSVMAAEINLPAVQAQLIDMNLHAPIDMMLRDDAHYRLDYSPFRRLPHTEVCFPGRWSPHKFREAGKLFVVPPGEDVRIRADPGDISLVICSLPSAKLGAILGEDFELGAQHFEVSADIVDLMMRRLMQQLAGELQKPGFASEVMVEGIATQIAVLLARRFLEIDKDRNHGGLAPWRLRAIDDALDQSGRMLTLTEIADTCQMSVRQLSRAFRKSRGTTIGKYIADRRLDIAKRLLIEGKSVRSVSEAVGFSSPSNFYYAFQRATAVAPRTFQDRYGKKRP